MDNNSHIENVFNNMLNDISYIKLTAYEYLYRTNK